MFSFSIPINYPYVNDKHRVVDIVKLIEYIMNYKFLCLPTVFREQIRNNHKIVLWTQACERELHVVEKHHIGRLGWSDFEAIR